jgi:putative PIN family toxin of toxin-antitoxin system
MSMRVVLDTNVLVAAIRSDQGASRILLVEALESAFVLVASVPLMLEYESVLTRPEHLEQSGLTIDDIQSILDAIAVVAEPVLLAYRWRPMLIDVDVADEMVLETAVNGHADLLVTLNARHFEPAIADFNVKLASPGEALMLLRKRP